MTADDPDASRWDRSQPYLPYLFILLPTVFSLIQVWRVEVLALALFAGAWYWFMVTAHPEWIKRPAVVIVYFALMLAAVGTLTAIDSMFTVTGLAAFMQSFTLLPGWWAYGGVTATAGVLVGVQREPGQGVDELLFSFFVAALVASTIGLIIQTISDQNESRRAMIAQLRDTGAKLAAFAEENANLQAQLLTKAREAGVLGERQRMAREIHDTIAQSLTAIITQLEVADTVIDDPPAALSRLGKARTLARESLQEARRSVQALRPAPLDDAQLTGALEEVAGKWSRANGVTATVSVTGEARPLHSEVEITLLRVAQEALANIAKYAQADRVALTLSYMEDIVVLDVRDNGRGFAPERVTQTPTSGFGLIAMRQRVVRLAGDFEIETGPGQGTGISASVPAIPPASDPDPADHSRNA